MNTLKHISSALVVAVLLFCLTDTGLAFKRQYEISGKTMGTFYSVKFISKKKQSTEFWQARVGTLLKQINKRLSMYDPKSELSLFNKQAPHSPRTVSKDFYAVLVQAGQLYTMTDGAWDGTLKPLVDLWGFGTKKRGVTLPDDRKIKEILSTTGFNHIRVKETAVVLKTSPVTLDFGSIAKGYGVDAVARLFVDSGITDVLVEIGGELSAFGKNKKHQPWSVGISRPDKNFARQTLFKIITLNNQSVATSGNYRNFFELGGKTYSHIIDPRTGYPTSNNIVSASVVAKSCTFADGLATALMVMDLNDGINLVNRLEKTECLIIRKEGDRLFEHPSDGFEGLVVK